MTHMPRDGPAGDARALLERGVAAGVISAAQRDALLALPAEPPAETPSPRGGGDRPALDGVTIAYWLGAALVVFALGWFLADRWETLGPAGVLAVVVAYAALLGVVAMRLARAGFPFAAGVACALVSLTVPVAAWSLLRLTGEWPASPASPLLRYEPFMATRRLVLELSTVLAVLLFLRFVPAPPRAQRAIARTPLAIPLAAGVGLALAECTTLVAIAVAGADVLMYMRGWAYGAAGALLFGVAYATDRRQPPPSDPGHADFAGWLYAVACLVLEAGLLDTFSLGPAARHGLVVVALAQLAASTRLRRRVLALAGMVNVIWYLGFLAFDVFKGVLSFPLLLAAFGVAVLVLTVLVQRRFPSLVRRDEAAWTPPSLPGGGLTAWAPAVVLAALLAVAAPRAPVRERQIQQYLRAHRDSARAARRRTGRPLAPPPGARPPHAH